MTTAHSTSAESAVVERAEVCSLSAARRVSAMLDRDPDGVHEGMLLPRGWQFILMAADTPRRSLRADGFPGLGVPLPDLGLPRLMIVGRSVDCHADIPVGAVLRRLSAVDKVVEKEGASGRMAIVTIAHRLMLGEDLALSETQTYALLGAERPSAPNARKETGSAAPPQAPASPLAQKTVVPDETLLFQYSALGFNSHKIHLDRQYAREVEGLPDLVVNGGLTNLLMTEFATDEMGLALHRWKTKHVAPLYCNRSLTLVGNRLDGRYEIRALDDAGQLCAVMEAEAT